MMNLKPARAFSVAEAMIALLIGSLILGFSAPMITKQLKHNNFTSIQTQILNKKIENVDDKSDTNADNISINANNIKNINQNIKDLTDIINNNKAKDYSSDIESLTNRITSLENEEIVDYSEDISSLQSQITTNKTELTKKITELEKQINPAGIVKFFYNTGCPTGWSNIGYEGHYIRVTTNSETSYSVGSTIGPSLPNITGGFPGIGEYFDGIKPSSYYNADKDNDGLYGALYRKNTEKFTKYGVPVGNSGDREDYFAFDASKSNAVYGAIKDNTITALNEANEVLPRAVHLVACRKN